MKNKSKFTQFINFLLIMLFLFADLSVYAKKKKHKKKKDKTSKSKTVKNTPATPPVNNVRVSVNTFRENNKNSGSSSSDTNETKEKSDDDKAEEVFEFVKNCLKPICKDDIDFDRCFNPEDIGSIIEENSSCNAKLKKYSNEKIQNAAKYKLMKFMARKLTQACEEVTGGKLENHEVEIPGKKEQFEKMPYKCVTYINYMAKPVSDCKKQEDILGSKIGITVGRKTSISCTPEPFGLNSDQLQCDKGMSMETKMDLINSAIGAVTATVQGGLKIAEAKRKRNELKEMDKIEGSGIWTFDGTSLSNTCYSVKREYKSSKKDKCDDGDDETPQWDSNGGYYCEDKTSTCKIDSDKYNEISLCGKDKSKPVPCVVELKDATDLSIKQKLSELIRANINKAGNNNDYRQMIKTQVAYNVYKENLQDGQKELDHFSKCNSFNSAVTKCNNSTSGTCNTTTNTNGENGSVEKDLSTQFSNTNIFCERLYNSRFNWSCIENNSNTQQCQFINGEWVEPRSVGEAELKKYNQRMEEADQKLDAMLGNKSNKSGFDVDAAKSAYTSNQNYLNSKNKEREELKAEADTAQKEAINSFTTTGMNIMNKAITSSMEAQSNKETLTGACYFSDKDGKLINRSPMMRDGESKKATWSFLQSVK